MAWVVGRKGGRASRNGGLHLREESGTPQPEITGSAANQGGRWSGSARGIRRNRRGEIAHPVKRITQQE